MIFVVMIVVQVVYILRGDIGMSFGIVLFNYRLRNYKRLWEFLL